MADFFGLKFPIVADDKTAKGINSAKKNVSGFEGKIKDLGKTLAGVFAAQKVIAFGKASAQAFLEAEKANARLAGVVKNLGLSFATAQIQSNLDEISEKAGIAGEVLIDAFQPLLTTTGSIIKSQELLALALDVSAGSGTELATVTQDLANAYIGNTKGLKKYNLGLTQAELKSIEFSEVQSKLNKQFSGSNAKYLETYAGKMQVLTEAAGNAQEIIGQGLVDALTTLGGDTSVADLAADMKSLATYIGDVIRGVGNLGKSFKLAGITTDASGNFDPTALIQAIPILGSYINMLRESGATKQSTGFSFFGSPMESTQKQRDEAARIKAERDAAKRAKEILTAQRKAAEELRKQTALKKAGSIFDKEQIQIIAALKGNISEEERKRLELQLALETENVTEAKKLTYELAIAQGLGVKLAQDLASLPEASNPFAAWKGYLDEVELQAKRIAAFTPMTVGAGVPATTGTDFGGNKIGAPVGGGFTPPPAGTYGTGGTAPIVVQIDGKTIASALMDQSLSGNQSYVNRRTGGFE